MRIRFVIVPAATLIVAFLIAVPIPASHAGLQTNGASCTGPQEITFAWNWHEYPAYPSGHPEWVGWDVLRRPIDTCGPFERINAVSFPRPYGESHSHSLVDTPPVTGETYEYQAIPVDADRNRVWGFVYPECDSPCAPPTWASCPEASAPLTIGEVQDWQWALFVQPCAGSCYPGFHLPPGAVEQELRAQGRIGTGVKLYGLAGGWGVEGPSVDPTGWEPGGCDDITPIGRTTWGALKTIYR